MRKCLCLLFAVLLAICAFPPVSLAAGGTITAGGTYALSDYGNDSIITIDTTQAVTLTGSSGVTYSNLQIRCVAGTDLTIENVNITVSTDNVCAMTFSGSGNKLTLAGDSTLRSGNTAAGIRVQDEAELTIQGDGTLHAYGGNFGAAIGGSTDHFSGTIRIISGTVYAQGGGSAAGIGGGFQAGGGTTTVSGGTVTAIGGYAAAGIGSGQEFALFPNINGGNINITGSVVTATGGEGAAGIGGGVDAEAGNISISNSTVTAYGKTEGNMNGTGIGSCVYGGGSVTIKESTVTAYGARNGAGIYVTNSVVISDSDIFAYGSNTGSGIDCGSLQFYGAGTVFASSPAGNAITGGSISMGGTISVFLQNDVNLSVTTNSHQHFPVTVADGKALGVSIPSGWNPTGAYIAPATLTYGLNGGTGPLDSVTQARGTDVILSSGAGLTNGALSVIGWNTKADGSGDTYSPNGKFTLTRNATLYAMWGEVTATGVDITQEMAELTVGDTVSLTASVLPDGASGTIVWASGNETVATVSDTGEVTALKPGVAVIRASVGSASDICVVFVTQPVTGIRLSDDELTITVGTKGILTAAVSPEDASEYSISWSSSDTDVAQVNKNGVITATGTGRATITAQAGGYSDTCEVTAGSLLMSIPLSKGKSFQLSAALSAGTGGASWSSSDPAIASVDASGNVKGIAEGNAVITVTAGGFTQQAGIHVITNTDSGGRSSRTAQPTLQPADPQAQCTPQIIYVPSVKTGGEKEPPVVSTAPDASPSPQSNTPPPATPDGSKPDMTEPESEKPADTQTNADIDQPQTQPFGVSPLLPWLTGGAMLCAGAGAGLWFGRRKR